MSSLSDYTDRLSRIAKSVNATASAIIHTPSSGPFTTAVLHTPLADLIRDVDVSELGLFTLQTRQGEKKEEEIGRVMFGGATPLKKGKVAEGKRKEAEVEPEIYAQAALKYLERFQSIRPMPRAREQVLSTLEQLAESRTRIQALSDTLEKINSGNLPPLSPKSRANDEERRIAELQKKIDEVKKRKEAVSKQRKPTKSLRAKPPPSTKPPVISSPPIASSSKLRTRPKPAPSTPRSVPVPQEDKFWTTPGQVGRVLTFSDGGLGAMEDESLLLDGGKGMDMLSEVSMTLEDTPVPNLGLKLGIGRYDGGSELGSEESGVQAWDESGEVDEEQDDDTKTIMLPKLHPNKESPLHPPKSSQSPPPRSPQISISSPLSSPLDEPATPSPTSPKTPSTTSKPTPGTNSKSRSKFKITTQTEVIIAKVWSTVGDLIMPGHSFGDGTGNRPPRAKETLVHLQSLSTLPPNPPSPSISSISSLCTTTNQPTQQGILTAHLILALLSSTSFKLNLKSVKEALAERGAGAGGTRVVYGCVAKRLIKIVRGGGEQVVMFDV